MLAALDDAGKVVKKQRTCAQKVDETLDKLIQIVESSRERLNDPASDPQAVLQEMRTALEATGMLKDSLSATKDLHTAIAKLDKSVDKAFGVDKYFDGTPDICKALRDVQFDQPTLNQVIAEHFFREGRFAIGESFVQEAGIPGASVIKQPFTSLHNVLKEVKQHNLGPALGWAQQHRSKLSPDGRPSAFEFKVHSLNYIHILTTQGSTAALVYAREHFSSFQDQHMQEIQRLMGCLAYARKSLEDSPYSDLLSPSRWEELTREFTRQACSLLGQSYESPLAVVAAAGSVALPQLLKLAWVLSRNQKEHDLRSCDQLPVELELGREFVFHSIFACPVSKDQSSAANPPVLLPCNHVLCEQSVQKIASKNRSRVFKCPYCPVEARVDNLRHLIFPDVD